MNTFQSVLGKLSKIVETNAKYKVEDTINKNLLAEDARKYNSELLNLLQKDVDLKGHFFVETDGGLIFKKDVFLQFISNKEFLPDSYTKYANKVGLGSDDGSLLSGSKEVVLNWPYKDTILEGGQDKEDQKRSEVFFNEVLAPDQITRLLDNKVFTNWKRYDKDGEHELDELKDDDNLIIKGNNLVVLHSLKKRYAGKVKLIYIDPPYNTGSDSFGYNDKFNHSTWLTFMKNRLEIARTLLRDDGVIIVQSDDNEQAYLRVLMDEVFGKDQFETSFFVQVRYENKTLSEDNDFQKVMETAHVFSKQHSAFWTNKVKQEYSLEKFCYQINELGPGEDIEVNGRRVTVFKSGQYEVKKVKPSIDALKETWATGSLIRQGGTAAEFLSKYLISRKNEDGLDVLYRVHGMGNDGIGYRYITGPKKASATRGKFYSGVPTAIKSEVESGDYTKEMPVPNLIYNFLLYPGDFGNIRHEGGVDIGGGKKPEILLKNFIEYFTNPEDIVLDYHLGSGTTAAVAHKTGRLYIGIEQFDYGKNDVVQRLQNVIGGDQTGISKDVGWQGGGSFVYTNIMNNANKFRERVEQAKNDKDYIDLLDEAASSSFLSYRVDPTKLNDAEFRKLSSADKRRLLLELIDTNTLYVNYEDINDPSFKVSDLDKKFNKELYK